MAFGENISLEISTFDFFNCSRSAIVEVDAKLSNLNSQQLSIVSVCVCLCCVYVCVSVCVCVCCVCAFVVYMYVVYMYS